MSPFLRHLRRLVGLAVPVVASQVGMMTFWLVDLLMLGRVGVEALDAASLGRTWIMGTFIFAMGLLLGIDPLATQAVGAGDRARLARALAHGLALALLTSLPVTLLWLGTEPALRLFGQPPHLAGTAHLYVLVQIPGLPFLLAFTALKQVLQARGVVYPAMWVTLLGNGFNALVNWILIFGGLGIPALGIVGAGIGTCLTEVLLFLALYAWARARGLLPAPAGRLLRDGFEPSGLREVCRYGAPVSLQLGLEMWTFQIATLMAGRLGEVPLAAHTVALTLASATFMLPLGISLAAVVRVGNLAGAGQPAEAQRAAWTALSLGGAVMVVSAIAFWWGRWWLPTLFTSEPAVVSLAAAILPVAAAFQIFDGLQVVGGGVLRGVGQTRPAAVFNLIGYYLLALPLAWWLGFERGLGVRGIWWGLFLGLAAVALLLVAWIARYGPGRGLLPSVGRGRG